MRSRSVPFISLIIASLLFISLAFYVFQSKPVDLKTGSDSHQEPPAAGVDEGRVDDTASQPDTDEDATGQPSTSVTSLTAHKAPVRGVVLDERTGDPVASASVSLAQNAPSSSMERGMWLATTLTDGEGVFELGDFAFGPYRLHAQAVGYALKAIRDVYPGDDTEVLLARSPGIPCQLRVEKDVATVPLPEQEVVMNKEDGGWSFEAKSDSQGRFSIFGITREDLLTDRSLLELEVVVPGFTEPYLRWSKDGDEPELLITVERGIRAYGNVYDETTGKPISNALVTADSGHVVETDARGAYSLSGVVDTIAVRAPGYGMEQQELDDLDEFDDLDTDDPDPALKVDLYLQPGVTLVGRVTDAEGRPIPGVRVGLGDFDLDLDVDAPGFEAEILEELAATTDRNGRYEIRGISQSAFDLPASIELQVRTPGSRAGIENEVDIPEGEQVVEHDIVLNVVSSLECVVTDVDGKPLVGGTVLVELVDDELYQFAGTDSSGRCRFQTLPYGDYRLAVLVNDHPVLVHLLRVPVEETLRLQVEPGKSVRGKVVNPVNGEPLAAFQVQILFMLGGIGLDLKTATDASGSFRFADVPPGNFFLKIRPPSPRQLFSPFGSQHRELIVVREDWEGTIDYPVRASGWIDLEFAVKTPDGTIEPANGPIKLTAVSYRLSQPTSPERGFVRRPRMRPLPLGDSDGNRFHKHVRAGEYIIRATLNAESGPLTAETTLGVRDKQNVEEQIIFERETRSN